MKKQGLTLCLQKSRGLTEEEKAYYDRHLRLNGFGLEAQLKLQQASVIVVGAGGLGCPVLQYLCAAGVGFITIVDDDVVSLSNLHRQVLYNTEDLGQSKALLAKQRLSTQNPFVQIEALQQRLDASNVEILFQDKDLIIDCSDNFQTRYLINDACVNLNKPFIYGALSSFEGQVSVFNYKDGATYRCLYPDMPKAEDFPSCSELGVLGVVPGIIGSLQALEAIKVLTNVGTPLSGDLAIYSFLDHRMMKVKIELNRDNLKQRVLKDLDSTCGVPYFNISDLPKEALLIDVRSVEEHSERNVGGLNIPLDKLSENIDNFSKEQRIFLYCKTGYRSQKASELLMNKGFKKVEVVFVDLTQN